MQWLDFFDQSTLPFPDSSQVLMTLSLAMYELLLQQVESFQERLNASVDTSSNPTSNDTDGDDVYFRLSGAAICEMLKLCYKQ